MLRCARGAGEGGILAMQVRGKAGDAGVQETVGTCDEGATVLAVQAGK